ncbi:MAG: hypothetical protein U1E76_10490 [Planctomycetota bacterium]
MGRFLILGASVVLAAAGCQSSYPNLAEQKSINTASIDLLNKVHVDQAIVAQRTLYPYHFVEGGVALNGLGERDLSVLAAHYAARPGMLNVYQGDTDNDLYRDRLQAVKRALAERGVDVNRMTFRSGLPGGEGLDATQSLKALEPARDASEKSASASASSMQSR